MTSGSVYRNFEPASRVASERIKMGFTQPRAHRIHTGCDHQVKHHLIYDDGSMETGGYSVHHLDPNAHDVLIHPSATITRTTGTRNPRVGFFPALLADFIARAGRLLHRFERGD